MYYFQISNHFDAVRLIIPSFLAQVFPLQMNELTT